jgi:hypothetical protein
VGAAARQGVAAQAHGDASSGLASDGNVEVNLRHKRVRMKYSSKGGTEGLGLGGRGGEMAPCE